MSLPILPVDAMTPEEDEGLRTVEQRDPFPDSSWIETWGPSARVLLDRALSSLRLTRSDEVTILTTSDATFVSTCVSITAFNHGRISRIVTESTKVVIVIHEFGYVYPDIVTLSRECRDRGIVLIEDCAHLLATDSGTTIGRLGDMALYSLPKVIPIRSGGLLRSHRSLDVPPPGAEEAEVIDDVRRAADRYLGAAWLLNQRRSERRDVLGRYLHLDEPVEPAVPWAVPVHTPSRVDTEARFRAVEFVSTLEKTTAFIPTNPLVALDEFRQIAESWAASTEGTNR